VAIEVNRRYLNQFSEEEEEGLLPPELPEVPAYKKVTTDCTDSPDWAGDGNWRKRRRSDSFACLTYSVGDVSSFLFSEHPRHPCDPWLRLPPKKVKNNY
jgi:hypothetical protein